MKKFSEMTHEEWEEAICQLAVDMGDLHHFSTGTLRRMYSEMYGIEDDINRNVQVMEVEGRLEDQDKEYTDELAEKISKYLERKFDANLSIYDNIDNAYDTLK